MTNLGRDNDGAPIPSAAGAWISGVISDSVPYNIPKSACLFLKKQSQN